MAEDKNLDQDYDKAGFGGALAFGKKPALLLIDFAKAYITKDCGLYAGVEDSAAAAIKLLAAALKRFPQFNCSIDIASQEVVQKQYYNIGIAVDTPNGLLVPVVRDVDQKNIIEHVKHFAARLMDGTENCTSSFSHTIQYSDNSMCSKGIKSTGWFVQK